MADYPAHLVRERRLADGRVVIIRPIRPQDEPGEQEFFDHLSQETRRLRFLKMVEAVNDKLIHFFTHIDYDRHMAFVCEHEGRLVGEARYVANPDGRSCEFGVVIADDWHHSGIAVLLMRALLDAARACGFQAMEGLVLRSNRPMLHFVKGLGFDAQPQSYEPTMVRIVKRLRSTSSAAARSAGDISTG
ncbi:MAG TPA: GNAT family N-acetyltransferase [Burkholderiales bacterium]|nr:GNAT family N-acetyltransferase [Burkholderiales bacterium]